MALLVLAALGVVIFIVTGVRWASMQRLLKEGEYRARQTRKKDH